MNMQQLMMQAQKMQRELKKAQEALAQKEFTVNKSGAVTVTMMGNKTIKSIDIDEDVLEKENKEMLQDLLQMAINELLDQIAAEEEAINSKVAGNGGFGF